MRNPPASAPDGWEQFISCNRRDVEVELAAHGTPLQSPTKDEVAAVLEVATVEVRELLQLRGELAKSSVKKCEAMQHMAGRDGRGRGPSSTTGQGAPEGSLAA